jgi:hypothetical protein
MKNEGVILAAILAVASGDYALVLPTERICAKSLAVCEAAREAIAGGRWPIAPQETPTRCEPSPNCFSPASNVIKGYNDR